MLLLWIVSQSLPKTTDITPIVSRALLENARIEDFSNFSRTVDEFVTVFQKSLPIEIEKFIPPTKTSDYATLIAHLGARFNGYQYSEYDVKIQPSALLQPQNGHIFSPKDGQSERVIAWLLQRLYMGLQVENSYDVKPDVYWHAFLGCR